VLLILAALLRATPAGAATYSWRGTSSGHPGADGFTYTQTSNWLTSIVPTNSDDALFDLVGVTGTPLQLATSQSVSTFEVSGVTVKLDNTVRLNPGFLSIGRSTALGMLELVGGAMTTGEWRVGDTGPGLVRLSGGSSVQTTRAAFGIGGPGTLHLNDAQSTWTETGPPLALGSGSFPGNVLVTAGTLTTAGVTGNNASIVLMGPSSKWFDTGVVTSTAGPQITGGAYAETKEVDLVAGTSVTGALVQGAGSQWLVHGGLAIGNPGLNVQSQGTLTTEFPVFIGDASGISAAFVSGSGSTWHSLHQILLGTGGDAYLQVSQQGLLQTSNLVIVGAGAAQSHANVVGGTWDYAAIQMGQSVGTLDVDAGGLLEGPGISFSQNQNVTETIHVSAGSRWHITGNQTIAGNSSDLWGIVSRLTIDSGTEVDCDGTMDVTSGGYVDLNGLMVADQVELFCYPNQISYRVTGDGTLRTNRLILDCTKSYGIGTFQLGHAGGLGAGLYTIPLNNALNASQHVIGYDAPATLTVVGTLNSSSADIVFGDQTAGNGVSNVVGSCQSGRDMIVANLGQGHLTLSAGASTVARDLAIAAAPGSNGTVTVGNGTLSVTGDGFVGGSRNGPGGTGRLDYTGTGNATIGDTLYIFGGGTVVVPSGTVSAAVIDVQGGTLKAKGHLGGKVVNSGDLSCQPDNSSFCAASFDSYEQTGAGTIHFRVGSVTAHDSITVAGTLVLGGTLALDVDPTIVPHLLDRIRLASGGSLSGHFDTVTGVPAASGGYGWRIEVQGGSVFLATYPLASVPAASHPALVVLAIGLMALGVMAADRARGERAATTDPNST
jgi:T5SS/PEP-CTERM-associated repeat protein